MIEFYFTAFRKSRTIYMGEGDRKSRTSRRVIERNSWPEVSRVSEIPPWWKKSVGEELFRPLHQNANPRPDKTSAGWPLANCPLAKHNPRINYGHRPPLAGQRREKKKRSFLYRVSFSWSIAISLLSRVSPFFLPTAHVSPDMFFLLPRPRFTPRPSLFYPPRVYFNYGKEFFAIAIATADAGSRDPPRKRTATKRCQPRPGKSPARSIKSALTRGQKLKYRPRADLPTSKCDGGSRRFSPAPHFARISFDKKRGMHSRDKRVFADVCSFAGKFSELRAVEKVQKTVCEYS